MIEFSAKYWREVAPFVDSERYGLVRCEPCPLGGALILATDGAQMAIFRDTGGVCSEASTVPYRQIDDLQDSDRIRIAPNVVFLVRGGVITGGAVYPEKTYNFPDWRRIIPAFPSGDPIYFDPKLLSKGSFGSESVFVSVKGTVATIFASRRTDAISFLAAKRSENKPDEWAWIAAKEPEVEAPKEPRRTRPRRAAPKQK